MTITISGMITIAAFAIMELPLHIAWSARSCLFGWLSFGVNVCNLHFYLLVICQLAAYGLGRIRSEEGYGCRCSKRDELISC